MFIFHRIVRRVALNFFGIDVDTEEETSKKEIKIGTEKKGFKKDSKTKEILIEDEKKIAEPDKSKVKIEFKNPYQEKETKEPKEKSPYKDLVKSKPVKPLDVRKRGFIIDIEKISDKGEDAPPVLHEYEDNSFLLSVADGMGGAGGTIYDIDYAKRSGAYLASRAINSIAGNYFLKFKETGYEIDESVSENIADDLKYHFDTGLSQILDKIHKKGNSKLNIKSSLIKRLPTTLALSYVKTEKNKIKLFNFWAGDSRIYALNCLSGLHQLTKDDLINKADAQQNLSEDSPLSNCVNADKNYKINTNTIDIDLPTIVFAATDGAFGYLQTPMHFEYLLVEALINSSSPTLWKDNLEKELKKTQSDDISLSLIVIGYKSFNEFKDSFRNRFKELQKDLESFHKIDNELNKQDEIISDVHKINDQINLKIEEYENDITSSDESFKSLLSAFDSMEREIKSFHNKIIDKKREIAQLEESIERRTDDIKRIKTDMEEADKNITIQKQKLASFKDRNKPKNADDANNELKSLKQLRDKLKKELWEKYKDKYEIYIRQSK